LEYLLFFKGKFYIFSSLINKKAKKFQLFVETLNTNSLQPNADKKKVTEFDYTQQTLNDIYTVNLFNFKVSQDSSKILIYFPIKKKKAKDEKFAKKTIGVQVLDENMTPLWYREITFPYDKDLVDDIHCDVDNSGNVFIVKRVYNEKKRNLKDGKQNFTHEGLQHFLITVIKKRNTL